MTMMMKMMEDGSTNTITTSFNANGRMPVQAEWSTSGWETNPNT